MFREWLHVITDITIITLTSPQAVPQINSTLKTGQDLS